MGMGLLTGLFFFPLSFPLGFTGKLESTKNDRKQLEEDAFQVAKVRREGGREKRENDAYHSY